MKQPLYQQLFMSLRPQNERPFSNETVEKRIRQNTMKMCGRGKHVLQYQHSHAIQPFFPRKDAQSDSIRLLLFSFVLTAKF